MTSERLAEDLLTLSRMLRPLRRADMTPQQYWLLRHLRRSGPVSIGELANALGITTGSATTACKRLEKAGLVSRQRQAEDEREVQVALTDEGNAQMNEWRQRKLSSVIKLLEVLDAEDQQQFQNLIGRLLETAQTQGFEA